MTNEEINYQNNPLHGLGLKDLLVELVDHYGFEILFAYLNINCFKTKPSIESSIKFLKKTKWAREKVEGFYLYQYKNLPRASDEQFELSPRDRIIPDHQQPGEPAELSLEDAERLKEKRAKKAAERNQRSPRKASPYGDRNKTSGKGSQSSRSKPSRESGNKSDPWANWKS